MILPEAVGLTKAGLYHHIGSKDKLLYEIQNYGMDILDETVLAPIKDIEDPVEKLRQTIIGHIDLIVRARDQEITVILHENRSLSGPLRKKLNARKRNYIDYLVNLIERVQQQSSKPPQVPPRLAAFALLGMTQPGSTSGTTRPDPSPKPTSRNTTRISFSAACSEPFSPVVGLGRA